MNEATKSMLELMVSVMPKSELEEFLDIGNTAIRKISRRESEARVQKRRHAVQQRKLELDAHEAEMRQTLRPGDVVQLKYDEERDSHARTAYAVVIKVNRVNVKLFPCHNVIRDNKRLPDAYRVWSRHSQQVVYHRPRYMSKVENAKVID